MTGAPAAEPSGYESPRHRGVRKGLDRLADEKYRTSASPFLPSGRPTDDEWAAYYDAWIGDAQSAER